MRIQSFREINFERNTVRSQTYVRVRYFYIVIFAKTRHLADILYFCETLYCDFPLAD